VKGKQLKLVVPQALIQEVIAKNHNPIFVAHPASKRTFELISLKYWWPKMRQSIEDYVRRCDKFQTRKSKHEFRAPLGAVEDPSEPFQVTSMDITRPYCVTPRKTGICLPSSTILQNMLKPSRSRTFRKKLVLEFMLLRSYLGMAVDLPRSRIKGGYPPQHFSKKHARF
jgi:hypothetical protein